MTETAPAAAAAGQAAQTRGRRQLCGLELVMSQEEDVASQVLGFLDPRAFTSLLCCSRSLRAADHRDSSASAVWLPALRRLSIAARWDAQMGGYRVAIPAYMCIESDVMAKAEAAAASGVLRAVWQALVDAGFTARTGTPICTQTLGLATNGLGSGAIADGRGDGDGGGAAHRPGAAQPRVQSALYGIALHPAPESTLLAGVTNQGEGILWNVARAPVRAYCKPVAKQQRLNGLPRVLRRIAQAVARRNREAEAETGFGAEAGIETRDSVEDGARVPPAANQDGGEAYRSTAGGEAEAAQQTGYVAGEEGEGEGRGEDEDNDSDMDLDHVNLELNMEGAGPNEHHDVFDAHAPGIARATSSGSDNSATTPLDGEGDTSQAVRPMKHSTTQRGDVEGVHEEKLETRDHGPADDDEAKEPDVGENEAGTRDTRSVVARWQIHANGAAKCVVWAREHILATGDYGGKLCLWDMSTLAGVDDGGAAGKRALATPRCVASIDAHPGTIVMDMCAAGEGTSALARSSIATAGAQGMVRLWDMRTMQLESEFPTGEACAYSVHAPLGRSVLLVGSQSGRVLAFDVRMPGDPFAAAQLHQRAVYSVNTWSMRPSTAEAATPEGDAAAGLHLQPATGATDADTALLSTSRDGSVVLSSLRALLRGYDHDLGGGPEQQQQPQPQPPAVQLGRRCILAHFPAVLYNGARSTFVDTHRTVLWATFNSGVLRAFDLLSVLSAPRHVDADADPAEAEEGTAARVGCTGSPLDACGAGQRFYAPVAGNVTVLRPLYSVRMQERQAISVDGNAFSLVVAGADGTAKVLHWTKLQLHC